MLREVTHWNTVCVLLTDSLSFRLALLERVLVLELGTHNVGRDDLLACRFKLACEVG